MTTIYQDGLVPGNMQVSLGGKIIAAAGGASITTVGVGFTAAITGSGVYTITLSDPYPQLWSCVATVASGTNLDRQCTVTATTDVVAGPPVVNNTIEITVTDVDTGTAVPLDDEQLHFHLTLVRSNAQ